MEASIPLTKEEEQMSHLPNPDAHIEPITGLDINPDFGMPDSPMERNRLIAILEEHKSVFSDGLDGSVLDVPPLEIADEYINEFHGVPLRHRYSQHKKLIIETWLAKMLKDKLIMKSKSKTLSPLVVASNGRVTIDARALNEVIPRIHTQIPVREDELFALDGGSIFGKFDLLAAYYQIPADVKLRELFAFSCHMGNFQFTDRLPLGEANTPGYFCNIMRDILSDLPASYPSYFDDVFVKASTPTEFVNNVEALLVKMKSVGGKFSKWKTRLGYSSIEALGFITDGKTYTPLPALQHKFTDMAFPTQKTLNTWLGLVNCFHSFIPDLATHLNAFSIFARKNAPKIEQTEELLTAFDNINKLIDNLEKLNFPIKGEEHF